MDLAHHGDSIFVIDGKKFVEIIDTLYLYGSYIPAGYRVPNIDRISL